MKKVCCLIILAGLFFYTGCHQEKLSFKERLIFVSDLDHPTMNDKFGGRPLTVADVDAFVDDYANTQVTTYMASASDGVILPVYRSKYARLVGDDDNGRLDCGTDTASYNSQRREYRNILNLEKEGTDVVEAQLKRAKEKGLEAFITFRMNDLHVSDTALHCPLFYGEFWLNHPEYWLNEDCGWHSRGALDFAHREVRELVLNVIFEQLEKYGAVLDGFDLDFLRFPVFFKNGEGFRNAHLMTGLLNAVKNKIEETGTKHRKKILLSVRVPADVAFCLSEGLDVKEWLQLGLLDFLTAGNFLVENPDVPVFKFIRDLGTHQIPVYVSIDSGGYDTHELHSHGMKRGIVSHIYAQGGNGIYLFNYFLHYPSYIEEGSRMTGQWEQLQCKQEVCRRKTRELLMELGSMETLKARNKLFALDDGSSARYYRYRRDNPLPLHVSSVRQSVTLYVGDNPQKEVPEKILLFLRTDRPAEFELKVNDMKAEQAGREHVTQYEADINLKKGESVQVFTVPTYAVIQGDNLITIQSFADDFRVIRLEMALRYGEVETHGYF
jgi:hypothetical protein